MSGLLFVGLLLSSPLAARAQSERDVLDSGRRVPTIEAIAGQSQTPDQRDASGASAEPRASEPEAQTPAPGELGGLAEGRLEAAGAIVRDVVYGHKDGMALVYDVLQPDRPSGAAVVYVVSGGWFSRWEPPESRAPGLVSLLERGFCVMIVHHGGAPRYEVPDAVSDVRRAVRHIRLTAPIHGIDPDRIGVFGGNSGGHLALMVALASDPGDPGNADPVLRTSNRVAAVVAYYPATDLSGLVGPNRDFPALDFDPALAARVSPVRFASEDDPPVLLVHGDADPLIPVGHSVELEEELSAAGAPVRLVRIPGAAHGFQDPEHRALATSEMVSWFERYLLPARP